VSARATPRALAALALLGCAVGVGIVSFERSRDQLVVLDACDRLAAQDYDGVLARTEKLVGASQVGRTAAECRCGALAATGHSDTCFGMLEDILAQPEARDWVPEPTLAIPLIERRRQSGQLAEAAALARRLGRAHPLDPRVFQIELATRAGIEDEARVLAELEARMQAASGDAALRMRVSLAQRRLQRGEAARALDVLGRPPDAGDEHARSLWFDTRGMAFAMAGDSTGARRAYEAWQAAGGRPAEVRARYALALSIAGLPDPEHSHVELLGKALQDSEALGDPSLREMLAIRLILTLVANDRHAEALEVYDRYRAELPLTGLQRHELVRSARAQQLAKLPPSARGGRLRFRAPGAPAGSALWLSPDLDAAADTPYEHFKLSRAKPVVVSRSAGEAPQRYVVRSPDGAVWASGAVSPLPGEVREVAIEPGPQAHAVPVPALSRRAGDGRRQVMLLLLDCGDWRIVQYLRARGELPVLDALLEQGWRAVLDSDPPLTAAALESLVWPRRHGDASLAGLLHQLGTEVAGLASVGRNPVDWLAWVLPEGEDLFGMIGAGDRRAANLLLAHGGIRAGRHGEVSGPHGARRELALGSSERELDAQERTRWPELAELDDERATLYVHTIAAELDTATELAAQKTLDFVALRVEPLDILTHAHFAEISDDGPDNGAGLLYSVYRYIDARIAAVNNALDADDVLIVMSDHGIRTAMEHSHNAFFVAVGSGIGPGRAPGRPALRGVSRAVADWLGVHTDWPETGLATGLTALAAAPAESATR
jgi:Type I phosphodiesterase / nucleotide pyrophosphatase